MKLFYNADLSGGLALQELKLNSKLMTYENDPNRFYLSVESFNIKIMARNDGMVRLEHALSCGADFYVLDHEQPKEAATKVKKLILLAGCEAVKPNYSLIVLDV